MEKQIKTTRNKSLGRLKYTKTLVENSNIVSKEHKETIISAIDIAIKDIENYRYPEIISYINSYIKDNFSKEEILDVIYILKTIVTTEHNYHMILWNYVFKNANWDENEKENFIKDISNRNRLYCEFMNYILNGQFICSPVSQYNYNEKNITEKYNVSICEAYKIFINIIDNKTEGEKHLSELSKKIKR